MPIRMFTDLGKTQSTSNNLKPNRRTIMEDFDEFNPNRCAEIAVGAFVALLAIGVVKVIAQSLLN